MVCSIMVVTAGAPVLRHTLAQGPSRDEAEVNAVVDRFYRCFQKKDLEGLMALWSEKLPDLAVSKQKFQQTLPPWGISS
jgi:hypothetical protein